MRLEHSIEIAAPVDRVWDLTTDVEAWPDYTPTMDRVERLDDGPIAVGSQARIKQPSQGERVWTVTALEPRRRFAWSTRAMGTRMTGGHHLEESGAATKQTLTIDIEGKLAPLVGLLLRMPIRKAIRQENEGFKAAAEGALVRQV
jgi:uncharacterized membrane protein